MNRWGCRRSTIEPLDNRRVQEFLGNYLPPEAAAKAWQHLDGTLLLSLVRNPYYLTILAFIIEHGARGRQIRPICSAIL